MYHLSKEGDSNRKIISWFKKYSEREGMKSSYKVEIMRKRIRNCVLAFVMTITSIFGASLIGAKTVYAYDIDTYAVACTCGGVFNPVKTTYTSWSKDGVTRKCKDGYPWGEDHRYSRYKVVSYKCGKCGLGYSDKTRQYKWECHGYK